MTHIITGIAIIISGGICALFSPPKNKGWFFLIATIIAQIFILPTAFSVLSNGESLSLILHLSPPIGNTLLIADSLTSFFLLIISLSGLLAAIYSIGYMKMYQGTPHYSMKGYYFFMSLLLAAMMVVTLIQNTLLFLIVWEIMSLASFFLVSFENDKKDVRKASVYYFIAMQIGVAFLISGFSWANMLTNEMNFSSLAQLAHTDKTITCIIFLLLFMGFGTKAGFIPMHTWLPRAHPAAPSSVSAMMSGVMIKTGIYGILRLILNIGVPSRWLAYLVFGIGLTTGIIGVVNAIAQHDLKKLLAYHSIENIGIIGMGIGLGMIGTIMGNPLIALSGYLGAILHIFNHFTFKSMLFYGAGAVYAKTHTRNIEQLGGLLHVMPYTAGLFLLASMAISGLPLFNGFISEFAIYLGMAEGMAASAIVVNLASLVGLAGLALIGVMAVICFTKVFGVVFQGVSRTQWQQNPTEVSAFFLIPMFILAGFILFIGLGAPLVIPMLYNVIQQFVINEEVFSLISDIYRQLSVAIWVLAGLIVFFTTFRWLLLRDKKVAVFKTWNCGYQLENPRFQYSASSFASSFLELAGKIVPLNKHLHRVQGLFPTSAEYYSHSDDFLELGFIRPVIIFLQRFLNLFSKIQSGHTQQYILYGLIFLIILIIWVIGVHS